MSKQEKKDYVSDDLVPDELADYSADYSADFRDFSVTMNVESLIRILSQLPRHLRVFLVDERMRTHSFNVAEVESANNRLQTEERVVLYKRR